MGVEEYDPIVSRRTALKNTLYGTTVVASGVPVFASQQGNLPNILELDPNGEEVNYSVEVTGYIARGGNIRGRDTNPDDEVGEDYAEGILHPEYQGDSYRYSGWITGFDADGPIRIWINKEEFEPDEVGTRRDSNEHILEIVEEGADATYRVGVSGRIERGGNINGRDSNPEDEVGNQYIDGKIDAGYQGDSYRYTGEITAIDVDGGPVKVLVDGKEVDPGGFGKSNEQATRSPECVLRHFQDHHLREEPREFQNRQERHIEQANRAKIIQQLSELNSAAIEALQAIVELRFGDYRGAITESIEFTQWYRQLTENTHLLAEETDQEFFQLLPPYSDHASSIYSLVNGPKESVSEYTDTIQEAVQLHREQDKDSLIAALRIAADGKLRDDIVGLAVEIGEIPLDDAVSGLKINALGQLALQIHIKSQLPILEELERLARKRDNETITEKGMYGYLIYKQEYWSSFTRFTKHTYNLAQVGRNNSLLFQIADSFNNLIGTSQLEGSKEGMHHGQDQIIAATRRLSMFREDAQKC